MWQICSWVRTSWEWMLCHYSSLSHRLAASHLLMQATDTLLDQYIRIMINDILKWFCVYKLKCVNQSMHKLVAPQQCWRQAGSHVSCWILICLLFAAKEWSFKEMAPNQQFKLWEESNNEAWVWDGDMLRPFARVKRKAKEGQSWHW